MEILRDAIKVLLWFSMQGTKIRKVLNVYYAFDFLSLLFVAFESHLEQNRNKIENCFQTFYNKIEVCFNKETNYHRKLTDNC